MAPIYLWGRVKQTSTTTGTEKLSLDGSFTGFLTFDDAETLGGIVDGGLVGYTIEQGEDWEWGEILYTRDTPYSTLGPASGDRVPTDSSNSGSPIDLDGEATVWLDAPANRLVLFDDAGDLVLPDGVSFTAGGLITSRAGGSLGNTYGIIDAQLRFRLDEAGQSIGGTATQILSANRYGNLSLVCGRSGDDTGSERFSDLVAWGLSFGTPTVVDAQASASADGRTYSVSGGLRLQMAGGSYAVRAVNLGVKEN